MIQQNSTPRFRPVIRVFVSSTFSDLKPERNALQAQVFPRLEQLCAQNGFQFQAIDLRWGVSSEAGLDHRTMRICFDELRRAQEISPRPNFLILLGNRYGWRPLPEEISVAEFQALEHAAAQVASSTAAAVLREWYQKDDNAVPPGYLLQSRRQQLPDAKDYTQDAPWNEIQAILWAIINRVQPPERLRERFDEAALADGSPPAIVRFQASATEQEIWHGALCAPDAQEHVLAFFRQIENVGEFSEPAQIKDFVDLEPSGRIDAALGAEQERLKEALRKRLGEKNVFSDSARLVLTSDAQGQPTADVTTDHLTQLCADVEKRMTEIIRGQIEEYWNKSTQASAERAARELKIEQDEHARFGRERGGAKSFVGRQTELEKIRDYLRNVSPWPLVVYGSSGCGKTALLARAFDEIPKTKKPIIRFIGTTPQSSDIRLLLRSLCQQLRGLHQREGEIPSDIKALTEELREQFKSATPDQPLIVFLDALDQLSDADNGRLLNWIPTGQLQPHVKLVVSCLSDRADDLAGQPFAEFTRRQLIAKNSINLDALSEDDASTLLFKNWLHQAGRKVSDQQREHIEQILKSKECRQPIYLKLLFEEARLWRSYDAAPKLGESVPAILGQLIERLGQPANHGRLLVEHVLGYLAASRHGLAENEILEVLFADPDYKAALDLATEQARHELPASATRIPIAIWSRLRFDLAPYLTERAAPGANVLTFYHRQVAEWVQEHFVKASEHSWQPHRRLADYFNAQWPLGNRHALHEVVYQMSSARQLDRLGALLGRFEFLRRRASSEMQTGHAGVYDLLDDLDLILEACDDSEPVRLLAGKVMDLRTILGMEAPFLALFPAALAQCCLNSGIESVRELAASALDSLDLSERLWTFSSRRLGFHAPQVALVGHTSGVLDCCLANGDRTVVSVAGMDPAILWNARTGRIIRKIDAGRVPPSLTSIAAQNFGNLIQTMATDNRIALLERHRLHLLDLAGTPIRTVEFESHDEARNGVASGSRLFVSLYHEIWEMNEDGELIYTFREHAGNQLVHSLDVTPDGSHLASVDASGHIVLRARKLGFWETLWEGVVQYEADRNYEVFLREMNELDWGKQNYEGTVLRIGLDSAASVVALAVAGQLQVFDATSRERMVPMASTAEGYFLKRVGPSREFAFFGGCRGAVRCIELFAVDSRTSRIIPTLLQDTPTCVSISSDGGTIIVGSNEKELVVADDTRPVEDAEEEKTDLPSDYVIGASLSRDEEYVACWSIDHRVVVWHARSGQIQYRWNGRERNADAGDRLIDVQFGPGSDWLAITRGEYDKCRTLIVHLARGQLTFDTQLALGYIDHQSSRERFVCRFSPDGGAAAILTHHELWIVNLSKNEIDFRVDFPIGLPNGDNISMEWSETVLIRSESLSSLAYYRLEPKSRVLEEVDAASIEAAGLIGKFGYPVERSGTRSVSMTREVDLHGQPPVFTRIIRIRDEEREWRYAMPASVTFVGLAPKSGYIVAGDKAGNFTTLWPKEGGTA